MLDAVQGKVLAETHCPPHPGNQQMLRSRREQILEWAGCRSCKLFPLLRRKKLLDRPGQGLHRDLLGYEDTAGGDCQPGVDLLRHSETGLDLIGILGLVEADLV